MILKRMKRRHNREQVIEFCKSLRVIRPEVSFGADIIAGFPTETDEMFENTKNLIAEAGLQFLHVFPYSERQETPAARMPQVEKHVRKTRAAILRRQGEHELHNFLHSHIKKEVTCLTEENSFAHTDNFIIIKLDREAAPNIITRVRLKEIISNNQMLAEVIT
jgi:threonylcarbamoyladenosine tRNA methylthiotransferase MtaB